MKIYNIKDTEGFFDTLAECRGEIKVIGKDGTGVSIGNDRLQLLRNTCIGGVINDIELMFKDTGDVLKMVDFMVSMDHVA